MTSTPTLSSADAFSPTTTTTTTTGLKPNRHTNKENKNNNKKTNVNTELLLQSSSTSGANTAAVEQVPTHPVAGMKPGTSGLRKKVEVWQHEEHYLQNFIQSLLDTAIAKRNGELPDT